MTELRHDGVVRAEVDDRVAIVTLNRPDQRNALSRELQRTLAAACSPSSTPPTTSTSSSSPAPTRRSAPAST